MTIEFVMPSRRIEQKLLDRGITLDEVVECFRNKNGKTLIDTREKNQTMPPTLWFISETNAGRILKIAFIYFTDAQEVHIKSAYEPDPEDIKYYDEHRMNKHRHSKEGKRRSLNMAKHKIIDDSDDWGKGKLGSIKHAAPAPKELDDALDEALGLQQFTLRLQKTLVADLKKIARSQGLGYQPLVRQILTKYAKEHALTKA